MTIQKDFHTLEEFYNSITWKPVKNHKLKRKNKKEGKIRRVLIPLCLAFLTVTASADDIATVTGATIDKVRLNTNWYGGGCLVYVPSYLGSKWCSANWVSFNCDEGKGTRTVRADLLIRVAVVSMAQRNLVDILINQSKINNGHCLLDDMTMNKEKAVE